VIRRLAPLLLLTVALVIAVVLAPANASTWIHMYLVAFAALISLLSLRVVLERSLPAGPSPLEAAARPVREEPVAPEDLRALERLVPIGLSGPVDLHYRLRPELRSVAAGILAGRGVDLDTQPAAARGRLGEETWELVRPDREPPAVRDGPALSPAALARVVASLEAAR
jgi:hypothetical protein